MPPSQNKPTSALAQPPAEIDPDEPLSRIVWMPEHGQAPYGDGLLDPETFRREDFAGSSNSDAGFSINRQKYVLATPINWQVTNQRRKKPQDRQIYASVQFTENDIASLNCSGRASFEVAADPIKHDDEHNLQNLAHALLRALGHNSGKAAQRDARVTVVEWLEKQTWMVPTRDALTDPVDHNDNWNEVNPSRWAQTAANQ